MLENMMEEEGAMFDFNNIPDDVLMVLFNYLSIPERRIFGRVCKKWYKISRYPDPAFWKNVVVYIKCHRTLSMAARTVELLKILPESLTSLKLYYAINFEELPMSLLSSSLTNTCPNLEELIIVNARITTDDPIFNLSNAFPKNLKVLKLRENSLGEMLLVFDESYRSNIEVFDISHTYINIASTALEQMPRLKELHLGGLSLNTTFFDYNTHALKNLNVLDLQYLSIPLRRFRYILRTVQENCINLKELYVCFNNLNDSEIRCLSITDVLPQLEVLCLRACPVTYEEINLLIQTRPYLQLVYVGTLNEPRYQRPEYNYALCNSAKVIPRIASFNDDCEHDETCPSFKNTI